MRYTSFLAATLALAAHCSARPDGVGGHHGDHGGHHVEHGAAVSTPAVSGPSGGYGAPEQSYDASAYEQPAYDQAAYTAPESYDPASYSAPSGSAPSAYDYEASDAAVAGPAFDMSSLLIPILIIAALMLIPTTMAVPVTGTAGRRKREAGGELHSTHYTNTVHKTYYGGHGSRILQYRPISRHRRRTAGRSATGGFPRTARVVYRTGRNLAPIWGASAAISQFPVISWLMSYLAFSLCFLC